MSEELRSGEQPHTGMIVVLEKRPRWTPELSRQFADATVDRFEDHLRQEEDRPQPSAESRLIPCVTNPWAIDQCSKIRIRASRSVAEVRRLLVEQEPHDKMLVVLDLEIGPADTLQLLGRFTNHPRPVSIVVMASRTTADLEWVMRELGVLDFYGEPPSGEELAHTCRRYLNR